MHHVADKRRATRPGASDGDALAEIEIGPEALSRRQGGSQGWAPAAIDASSTSFRSTNSAIVATRSAAPGIAIFLPTSVARRLRPASVSTADPAAIVARSRNRPSGMHPLSVSAQNHGVLPRSKTARRAERAEQPRNILKVSGPWL